MERHEGRTAVTAQCERTLKRFLIGLLDLYRVLVSPYIPTECRFYPTCSSYVKESIQHKGIIKGLLYGIKRILKCNPFHPGGYDPVQ